LVAAPLFDLCDDRGVLAALVQLDLELVGAVAGSTWAWLAFFLVLAAAFAHLFPLHRARTRVVFFAATAAPVAGYWFVGGFRLSVVLGVLLLALGLVSWGIAGFDADPAQ
jgi:hypothetical protein